jgi:hypothetical protein
MEIKSYDAKIRPINSYNKTAIPPLLIKKAEIKQQKPDKQIPAFQQSRGHNPNKIAVAEPKL